jgi:integrase
VSVERVERKDGVVWRVRWREGGRNRARTVGRKRGAEALDAETRRRMRVGELKTLDAGRETLAEFGDERWQLYVVPTLADRTRRSYAGMWDRHVLPRLGGRRLRDIRPEMVERFRADLHDAGVGDPTIYRVLALLQGVMQRAVEWQRIGSNPVRLVRKPRISRIREVRPLPPQVVETMRGHLMSVGRHRDATMVPVLAYAGVRPSEMLALSWDAIRERTLLVERATNDGGFKSTKGTGRARTVRLLAPLATDLAEWRMACGRPADDALVFPDRNGGAWTDSMWQGWHKDAFRPAKLAAGVPKARPYDLRHSFVSLLIHEGVSIIDIARQAGHNPTMTLEVYGHVFDEFDPTERVSAETQIRRARGESVPVSYPPTEAAE